MTTPTEGPVPEEPQQPTDPFAAPPPSGAYPPPPLPVPGDYPAPPPVYGAPPAGYAGGPYAGAPKNNPKAIWSLVIALIGFCLSGCGIVLGPVAIVLGLQARREIDASGGTQTGRGLAQAGFIIGIIVLVLGLITIAWIASGRYPGLERN